MTRMTILPSVAAALALAGCASASGGGDAARAPAPARAASAALNAADGGARGSASVAERDGGLEISVSAKGLSMGAHGIHLHTVGKCDAPDFMTAGGHWNPTARKHGRNNPDGAHSGDLPNLIIGTDGAGSITFIVPGATLSGPNGLLDADGAAVVIHAGADDYVTDPSGNSGGRIACGVLG